MTLDRARLLLALGALFGAAAVALDAAASHALAKILDPRRLSVLSTAVRLSELHAALLVVIGLALSRGEEAHTANMRRHLMWAGSALLLGLVLFGGGLTAYALSGLRPFVHAAPVGGLAWISAWLLLASAAIFGRSDRQG